MRDFVGLSGTQRIPDRVSNLRFRHLLEAHDLSPKILKVTNAKLAAQGLLLKTGTVVDATLIAAPSSTKNKDGECDPEMHQTKKGKQWHMTVGHPHGWGMKAHIGVDADSGLMHTVIGTAANVGDVTQGHALLNGQEQVVYADVGCQGAPKRDEVTGVDLHIAMRPGKRSNKSTRIGAHWPNKLRRSSPAYGPRWNIRFESSNAILVTKVRYRGLKKNTTQLMAQFALSNIWMARKTLLQRARP